MATRFAKIRGERKMKKATSHVQYGFTQLDLTTRLLRNINKWKLKPTTINVLACLSTYFPNIYPGQQKIADNLKISKRSVERAFVELRNAKIIVTVPNEETNTLNCTFTNVFFEMLGLSEGTRQIVEISTDKMSNKQTNVNKQVNNVSYFSSSNGRVNATPEETKELLKTYDEVKKVEFNPLKYSEEQAINYVLSLKPIFRTRGIAKTLIEKYNIAC